MINDKLIPQNSSLHKSRSLPSNDKYIPKAYKEIAEGMERQFAEYLITQLEKSVSRGSMNSAEKYYRSLQTSERAKMMSKSGNGLGIQKMILDQVYPTHLRNKINYELQVRRNDNHLQKKAIQMYQNQNESKSSVDGETVNASPQGE